GAIEEVLDRLERDGEPRARFGDRARDRVARRTAAEKPDFLAPELEPRPGLLRPGGLVDGVVDGARQRIDRIDRAPLRAREKKEGIVETRAALPRDAAGERPAGKVRRAGGGWTRRFEDSRMTPVAHIVPPSKSARSISRVAPAAPIEGRRPRTSPPAASIISRILMPPSQTSLRWKPILAGASSRSGRPARKNERAHAVSSRTSAHRGAEADPACRSRSSTR